VGECKRGDPTALHYFHQEPRTREGRTPTPTGKRLIPERLRKEGKKHKNRRANVTRTARDRETSHLRELPGRPTSAEEGGGQTLRKHGEEVGSCPAKEN